MAEAEIIAHQHRPRVQAAHQQLPRELEPVAESQRAARAQSHDGKRKSPARRASRIVGRPHFDGLSRAMKRRRQFFTVGGRAATERRELVRDDHDPRFCPGCLCHAWAPAISTDLGRAAKLKNAFTLGWGLVSVPPQPDKPMMATMVTNRFS